MKKYLAGGIVVLSLLILGIGNIVSAGVTLVRNNNPVPAATFNTWTPRESDRVWTSITSSADGTKLAAVVSGGKIYTSTDSGFTWTPRESNRQWLSIASSADGAKLAATVQDGQIYTSTDSGVTWTPRDSNRQWLSIASSADGTRLVAIMQSGQIYTSANSGVTWTPRESNRYWRSITSSADGMKLAAVAYSGSGSIGQIYTSTDGGVTWILRNSSRSWAAITSSADGAKLAAVVSGGQIYTSADSGVTWTPRESNRQWLSITSSADGTKLAAIVNVGQIYVSTNSGVTWTPRESNRGWWAIALSSDGKKLAAVASVGKIYTSTETAVPAPFVVTSPKSGDSLVAGQSYKISWTGGNSYTPSSYTGSVYLIRVGAQGSTYVNNVNLSGPGGFDFKVSSSTIPGSYQLQFWMNNATTINSGTFNIVTPPPTPTPAPLITITSPTAGAVWQKGNSYTVTWNSQGLDPNLPVGINLNDLSGISGYVNNSFVVTTHVAVGGPKLGDGKYTISLKDNLASVVPVGNKYKVEVFANTIKSDGWMPIALSGGYISITANPGISAVGALELVDCNTIKGRATDADVPNTALTVKLYDGATKTADKLITTISTGTNGVFSLPTPNSLKNGVQHPIYAYVVGKNPNGTDAADVAIGAINLYCGLPTSTVQSPNGGEKLKIGIPTKIYWYATNAETVDIRLVTSATNASTSISENVKASVGSIDWTPTATGTYKIAVIAKGGTRMVTDLSNATFTVIDNPGTLATGSLEMADCVAIKGRVADVDAPNTVLSVKLYEGTTKAADKLIATIPTATNGVFSIPTPNSLKNSVVHPVYAYVVGKNPNGTDAADVAFGANNIYCGNPTITVTAPNSGVTLKTGVPTKITWYSTYTDTVDIRLVAATSTVSSSIATNVPASIAPDGVPGYNWTPTATGTYKIALIAKGGTRVSATSTSPVFIVIPNPARASFGGAMASVYSAVVGTIGKIFGF